MKRILGLPLLLLLLACNTDKNEATAIIELPLEAIDGYGPFP
ncbi:hypothetical protein [Robertkochia sediminum]|nr:hypothetical protein [Robertkochia sediminum]